MKFSVDVKEINYGTIVVDAKTPEEAIEKAYVATKQIKLENGYYRNDIGQRARLALKK